MFPPDGAADGKLLGSASLDGTNECATFGLSTIDGTPESVTLGKLLNALADGSLL